MLHRDLGPANLRCQTISVLITSHEGSIYHCIGDTVPWDYIGPYLAQLFASGKNKCQR